MNKDMRNRISIIGLAACGIVTLVIAGLMATSAQADRRSALNVEPVVVNHESVALFDRIPAEYITAAAQLRMLFMDKSVGDNISGGLDCLTGNGPVSCGITGPQPYSRANWRYEWFAASGCGGWNDLQPCFVAQVHPVIDAYDVVMYDVSYMEVDQAGALAYFGDTPASYEITDYVRFLTEHGKPLVFWTSSLNRGADGDAAAWNAAMRAYADAQGAYLFDLADILSHRPNGEPCTSLVGDYPAICWPDYTTQTTAGGGHLSKAGQVHVAKALWVLMAQLAGWAPDAPEPEPSATPTNTPTEIPSATPSATATSILQSPLPTPTSEPTETSAPTPVPVPTQPTVTPTFTSTPTATATPVLCPFDARTSATVGAALQLWLEVWPAAQRYRDAANGSGSIEPLTEAEVSALITACWTRANVSGAGYYRGDR